jgi:hypothetical protein
VPKRDKFSFVTNLSLFSGEKIAARKRPGPYVVEAAYFMEKFLVPCNSYVQMPPLGAVLAA